MSYTRPKQKNPHLWYEWNNWLGFGQDEQKLEQIGMNSCIKNMFIQQVYRNHHEKHENRWLRNWNNFKINKNLIEVVDFINNNGIRPTC